MKTKILSLLLLCATVLVFMSGCKKEVIDDGMARVKIKIDYLGAGGYYNDDMAGVPSGLIVGVNGPFEVDPDGSYTLTYKAASNYGEAKLTSWSPTTTGTWVVHCYVENNVAHLRTYLE